MKSSLVYKNITMYYDSESANVIWKDVGVVDAAAWTSSNQKRQHRLRPRLLSFNSLLKFAALLDAGYLDLYLYPFIL